MQRLLLTWLFLIASSVAFANPKQAAVHSRQGKAYFEAKQYDQAIVEFKKAFDLDGKAVTLFKIASAYYAKADYQSAIEYYAKYLGADPDGPLAQQALEFTTIANKALADAKARADAEAKAKSDADAKAKADAEAAQKRVAAASHTKQAEAYAQARAWTSAGAEYLAAAAAGDDPEFLIAAAEAFGKQPDHEKARAAYLAYLEKVPLGPKSDAIRGNVAELKRTIDVAAADKAAADKAAADKAAADQATAKAQVAAPTASSRRARIDLAVGPELGQATTSRRVSHLTKARESDAAASTSSSSGREAVTPRRDETCRRS